MDIKMVIQLIGGLGLFIYGMKVMAENLEKAAGDKLRRGLEVLTTNRFAGAGCGVRHNDADSKLIRNDSYGCWVCQRRSHDTASGVRCDHGREYRYNNNGVDYFN